MCRNLKNNAKPIFFTKNSASQLSVMKDAFQ